MMVCVCAYARACVYVYVCACVRHVYISARIVFLRVSYGMCKCAPRVDTGKHAALPWPSTRLHVNKQLQKTPPPSLQLSPCPPAAPRPRPPSRRRSRFPSCPT